MIEIPKVKQKKIQISMRRGVADDLRRFVDWAAQYQEHATVDNVVVYMVGEYLASMRIEVKNFRSWRDRHSPRSHSMEISVEDQTGEMTRPSICDVK